MPRRYRPMPPLTHRAERALRKCIKEKWELRASGGSGALECELCVTYPDDCEGCPVALRARVTGCRNTPYDDWSQKWALGTRAHSDPLVVAAAKKELRFLKDTLRLGLAAREEKASAHQD